MPFDDNHLDAYDVPFRLIRAWNPKESKYARKSGGQGGGFGDFPLYRRLESTEKHLTSLIKEYKKNYRRDAPFRVQIILANGQEKLLFYHHAADAAIAAISTAKLVQEDKAKSFSRSEYSHPSGFTRATIRL